jgi:integrase
MAKTIVQIEPGIYRRVNPKTGIPSPKLWITSVRDGKTVFVSAKTTKLAEARKAKALAVAAAEHGTPQPKARLLVSELLDRLIAYHEKNKHPSLGTAKGHVAALNAVLGKTRARDLRTVHIDAMQRAWQREGTVTDVTINKRCESLRRALNLARQAGDLSTVPHVPRLKKAKGIRGKYIPGADHALLAEHLPDYVVLLLDFARLYGTRRGQLSRTQRAWFDPVRRVIEWPPQECKSDEAHTIPVDDAGLAILSQVLREERPWCPYLFHGPYCHPGRRPSKVYGCVGDFKKAWAKACAVAGLPVGRKAGGYTFHHTRNTAVTDMLASGTMSTGDAMHMSGHKTESMIKHYNLGNTEALRERLERARIEVQRLQGTTDAVRPLHSIATASLPR